jgi:hypothetical protein
MKNRKTLLSKSGFNLVQVDILDGSDSVIRVSYEVVDPDEDAIGRFGSLTEAQNFINMLCHLNYLEQEQEQEQEIPIRKGE